MLNKSFSFFCTNFPRHFTQYLCRYDVEWIAHNVNKLERNVRRLFNLWQQAFTIGLIFEDANGKRTLFITNNLKTVNILKQLNLLYAVPIFLTYLFQLAKQILIMQKWKTCAEDWFFISAKFVKFFICPRFSEANFGEFFSKVQILIDNLFWFYDNFFLTKREVCIEKYQTDVFRTRYDARAILSLAPAMQWNLTRCVAGAWKQSHACIPALAIQIWWDVLSQQVYDTAWVNIS